jgi:hypothetical protein
MASCAKWLPRLQIQNFATGVSRRVITCSCGSLALSKLRARRSASAVDASDSSARSASTFFISGCSIRRLPKALRCAVWFSAMPSAWRIRPLVPRAQSSRVTVPMARICDTPRPSSPTSQALAPVNSTSELALALLPSLSFRRWMNSWFIEPSGSTRGRNRQLRPLAVCARIRKASHMGAEKNHLWPVTLKRWPQASLPAGSARVVLARTSEPPCFSVMPMPMVRPALSRQTLSVGS